MKLKRAVAAVLSTAVVIGSSGCGTVGARKDMPAIDGLLKSFNTSLNSLDCDGLRVLTDWNKNDFDYSNIEDLLDVTYYGDTEGEGFVSCAGYIASTIMIDYDIKALKSYGNKASLEVQYELVDWRTVYSWPHESYDDVLNDLRNSDETMTVFTNIVFEKVDGRWRLCQIYDLNEVLGFIHSVPVVSVKTGGV